MKQRKLNEKVRREHDPIPWRYCILTLICGLLLVVGFFWAARQHFSAMDLGIKNAKLRQQKSSLESEQRLLERNKEVSLAPAEITKAAKKLGLQDLTAESFEVIAKVKDKLIEQNPLSAKTFVAKTSKVEKAEPEKKAVDSKDDSKKDDSKKETSDAPDLREKVLKK